MKSDAILSATGLCFSYNGGKSAVLRDLSLTIATGATTVILGPNGSGKTTLLRLLLGVLRPSSGQVLLAGRQRDSYSRQERSQMIGLVPQDEHIPFDFTVLEYVLMGRAPYLSPLAMPSTVDHHIAIEALHTVGLEHLRDRPLPTLSGGERQLATVARALTQQPQVLLLDEPTAHLDLSNQGRLLGVMRDLSARSVTLVLTTHDPNLAPAVASFAVLMRRGQVQASGPPDVILTAQNLSATYGVPVQVIEAGGRRVILLANQAGIGRRPSPASDPTCLEDRPMPFANGCQCTMEGTER